VNNVNTYIYYTSNVYGKNEIAEISRYMRRYRFENNFVGSLK